MNDSISIYMLIFTTISFLFVITTSPMSAASADFAVDV